MIEHADDFIADNDWATGTAYWYKRQLTIWFEYATENNLSMETLKPGQFTRFLNQMRRNDYSYSVRNGCYTAVAKYSKWLRQEGHIERSIFVGEDKPQRPRREKSVVGTVAIDYIRKMVAHAEGEQTPMNVRNVAILMLLATMGLRRGEVAGLGLKDVDFSQSKVTLRETKYKNQRVSFLLPDTAYALKRWLGHRPQTKHDKVFVSLHPSNKGQVHQPMRGDSINKVLDRMKREAGIGAEVAITPHMLRHTFASQVVKGGNPFALRDLLGHSDIKTTEIYVHNDERELKRIANYAPKISLMEEQ
mgnify:CR=1 FL=1